MGKTKSRIDTVFIRFLGFSAAFAVFAGFGIITFILITFQKMDFTSAESLQRLSMLGEFLGGAVGSIWALAGVILFFLALIYQRRELVLQREELQETRKILSKQSKTIEIQQFENTFFQLLEFHLAATKRIENQVGGNGFDKMFADFKKAINDVKKKRKRDGSSENLDAHTFENSFGNIYDGYRNTLSHYIESYKALLFLVDKKSKDPLFYVNIIKPHLTEQEVLIQFYYLVLYNKDKQFKRIVENYGLFERLNLRAVQAVDKLHLEELKDSSYKSKSS